MSKKGKNQNTADTAPPVPMSTKMGYIGTGILIGLIAYPFVRKVVAKAQPRVDELLDQLTGKAEEFAERASDMLSKAKETLDREKA
jgi:hypothetical protein